MKRAPRPSPRKATTSSSSAWAVRASLPSARRPTPAQRSSAWKRPASWAATPPPPTPAPMALNSEFVKEFYADQTNGEDYIDEDAVFETWMEYVESDEKEDVIRPRGVRERRSARLLHRTTSASRLKAACWAALWCPNGASCGSPTPPTRPGRNKLGPNKTYQFDRAVDLAIEKSPESEFMLETTATEMITDDTGAVVGVKCQNVDGNHLRDLRQDRHSGHRRLHCQRRHDDGELRRYHPDPGLDAVRRLGHPAWPVGRRRDL